MQFPTFSKQAWSALGSGCLIFPMQLRVMLNEVDQTSEGTIRPLHTIYCNAKSIISLNCKIYNLGYSPLCLKCLAIIFVVTVFGMQGSIFICRERFVLSNTKCIMLQYSWEEDTCHDLLFEADFSTPREACSSLVECNDHI